MTLLIDGHKIRMDAVALSVFSALFNARGRALNVDELRDAIKEWLETHCITRLPAGWSHVDWG